MAAKFPAKMCYIFFGPQRHFLMAIFPKQVLRCHLIISFTKIMYFHSRWWRSFHCNTKVILATGLKRWKPHLPFDFSFFFFFFFFFFLPREIFRLGNAIFYYVPICIAAKYVFGRKSNMGEIRPRTWHVKPNFWWILHSFDVDTNICGNS